MLKELLLEDAPGIDPLAAGRAGRRPPHPRLGALAVEGVATTEHHQILWKVAAVLILAVRLEANGAELHVIDPRLLALAEACTSAAAHRGRLPPGVHLCDLARKAGQDVGRCARHAHPTQEAPQEPPC